MSVLYDISIQWKDDGSFCDNFLVSSGHGVTDLPNGYSEEDIFYYGLEENKIIEAIDTREWINDEWRITSYNGLVVDRISTPDIYYVRYSNYNHVNGYDVERSILFPDDRGFAFAYNVNAVNPYVTWQFTEERSNPNDFTDRLREYYWGHYFNDRSSALEDYENRIDEFISSKKENNLPFDFVRKEILAPSFPDPSGIPFQFHTVIEGKNTFPDSGVIDPSYAFDIFLKIIKDPPSFDYDPRFDNVVLGFVGQGYPFTSIAESLNGDMTLHDLLAISDGKPPSCVDSIKICHDKASSERLNHPICITSDVSSVQFKALYEQQISSHKNNSCPDSTRPDKPASLRDSR